MIYREITPKLFKLDILKIPPFHNFDISQSIFSEIKQLFGEWNFIALIDSAIVSMADDRNQSIGLSKSARSLTHPINCGIVRCVLHFATGCRECCKISSVNDFFQRRFN
jgi:hypothetical protein